MHRLLREYTDGSKADLNNETFVMQLVEDTDKLNLIATEGIKPTTMQVSLAALLLRA